MTTSERLGLLGGCAPLFEPWTGSFEAGTLSEWLAAELGDIEALDKPIPHGALQSQARAPKNLLHVVSENTPHAAFQSLLRGLVVGSNNLVKLPSSGLPALENAAAQFPAELGALVRLEPALPPDWTVWADAVVVFGNDETLSWFAAHTPPTVRLVGHGHKFSIAVVSGEPEIAARLAARDVSLFDQQGCLSLHDVFLTSEAGLPVREFAALLAEEMQIFEAHTPRSALSPAESGALTSLRESVRFMAASQPGDVALWESEGSTAWTVIFERDPLLKLSPLNRFVYVKPWPEADPAQALGPHRKHLSSLALHPFDSGRAASFLDLGATRLCPLGTTQEPSLFWHHDGVPPLASLVTWVDIG